VSERTPIPPESRGRRPVARQPDDVASAYDLAVAGEAAQTRAALRAVLASPARARTAVLAAEILGLPRSLRPYGAS
jgi:hypothetical protein